MYINETITFSILVLTVLVISTLEWFHIVRRCDVDLFKAGLFLFMLGPYIFIKGDWIVGIIDVVLGLGFAYRWWKHKDDDDDNYRGRRWRYKLKSKFPKSIGKLIYAPVRTK